MKNVKLTCVLAFEAVALMFVGATSSQAQVPLSAYTKSH